MKQGSPFVITPFTNPSGEIVFRVIGWLDGKRVRKNFPTRTEAEAERQVLTVQNLQGAAGIRTAITRLAACPLGIVNLNRKENPMSVIPPDHLEKLRHLPAHLREHIRGQDHAIEPVCSVLRRGELGLANPSRPRGSFLFVGPTGVGKTEIANIFTAHLFAEAKPLRFDMSEYQNQSSVEKLIGGHPDDTGLLGRALARAERGTLLFDEVEKAHPLVLDLFLQILDDAAITLATGERKNLSGFYVVFTSNIGAAEAMRMQSAPFASIERTVLARVGQQLRPELIGRMTEKIVFNRLPYAVQREICEHMVTIEQTRLHCLGYTADVTPEDFEHLLREGHHKTLGVRPMRATVERHMQGAVMIHLLGPSNQENTI